MIEAVQPLIEYFHDYFDSYLENAWEQDIERATSKIFPTQPLLLASRNTFKCYFLGNRALNHFAEQGDDGSDED